MTIRIWKYAAGMVVVAAIIGGPSVPAAEPAAGAGPATTQAAEPGPSKFYGTISAVDAAAGTFTVDKQTFAIVAESQLTKAADGSAATIADAVVGETARGTYTKSSDGKLKVTKVRFGKKTGGNGGGGKKDKQATTKPKGE
jgi:hypothetical protein